MNKCKNCGASDFKDGKCSYCGTEYGLTGDVILDEYLITQKRINYMKAEGFEFKRNDTEGVIKWEAFNSSIDWKYFGYSRNINEAVTVIWEMYCAHKFSSLIND